MEYTFPSEIWEYIFNIGKISTSLGIYRTICRYFSKIIKPTSILPTRKITKSYSNLHIYVKDIKIKRIDKLLNYINTNYINNIKNTTYKCCKHPEFLDIQEWYNCYDCKKDSNIYSSILIWLPYKLYKDTYHRELRYNLQKCNFVIKHFKRKNEHYRECFLRYFYIYDKLSTSRIEIIRSIDITHNLFGYKYTTVCGISDKNGLLFDMKNT